ncbi:MAG: ROK family protein [Candidatus Nanoarchaeia archaeon]
MYVGVDIGGTKMLAILFDGKKAVKLEKLETEQKKNKFVKEIIKVIEDISRGYKIEGIGLGLPGLLDRKNGEIINLPNLHMKNIPIKKIVEKHFKVPVIIEKDANCMAIAEHRLGLAKSRKNAIVLTLGTGIGGGFILNNNLYIGRGCAAEVGHMNIEPEGYLCNCGNKGCLEEYISGRAIMRLAKNMGINAKNPREVEFLARDGNKKAREVYKKIGYYLGVGIASIVVLFDPEIIILSGSLIKAHDLFLEETIKTARKKVFFKTLPEIKLSNLDNSPALGAACLFYK